MDAPRAGDRADARRLRGIKVLLLGILLLMVAARGRDAAWPFVAWSMYTWPPTIPGRAVAVEARFVGRSGDVLVLRPAAVFTPVEKHLAERILLGAFTEEDPARRARCRAILLARQRARWPARDVAAVEGWRLTWTIEPSTNPPFDRAAPDTSERLGRFTVGDVPVRGSS